MGFRGADCAGAAACAIGLLISTAAAAAPAISPAIDKGDTAWMMTASVLVLLMTIPGLALFYGGLVRAKNMLSVLAQVFYTVCVVCILWALYGYSLTFTGGSAYLGGLTKAFMDGITPETSVPTFTAGVHIPELVYFCFQMTFAAITPALIVGAFAERMRFAALALFVPLWATLIYFPIAHMVWYWPGPDAIADAVAALAAANGEPARVAAQARLDAVMAEGGQVYLWGALDFAGGTVVHINAGIAGLVGALLIGKRVGYGRELLAPHALPMTMIGAALLWVGWFGFNAGSALEASGSAALSMTNSFLATAAAGLAWMFAEWIVRGHPSLLGALSGAVAGLVAVTPAAGFSGPMGALVLGLVAGLICLFACTVLKNALGYDDSLDVFGIHCVGGIVGALATGILVNPALGGTGVMDYVSGTIADYDLAAQMVAQGKAVATTLIWSGLGSAVLYKFVDLVIGLRASIEVEREGLDVSEHTERAYNM